MAKGNGRRNWMVFGVEAFDAIPLPFPRTAGVYAIYLNGQLQYIGSSENVCARISQHGIGLQRYSSNIRTPWGDGQVTIKVRPSKHFGDWLMIECRLIRRLKPIQNRRGIKIKRVAAQ